MFDYVSAKYTLVMKYLSIPHVHKIPKNVPLIIINKINQEYF